MTAFQTEMLSTTLLLAISVAMTAGAMWAGARMTPWFLREAVAAPSVRALILAGDDEMPMRTRLAACGLSTAVMLAVLLVTAIAVRLMGWNAG